MSFRVKIEPEAEAEIIEAFNWYETQSPGLGGEFLRAVKQAEAIIARNPYLYQVHYRAVRRGYLRRFPYALHYLNDGEDVSVISCYHFRRDPGQWKG